MNKANSRANVYNNKTGEVLLFLISRKKTWWFVTWRNSSDKESKKTNFWSKKMQRSKKPLNTQKSTRYKLKKECCLKKIKELQNNGSKWPSNYSNKRILFVKFQSWKEKSIIKMRPMHKLVRQIKNMKNMFKSLNKKEPNKIKSLKVKRIDFKENWHWIREN